MDALDVTEVVKLARQLERLLARRRALLLRVRELDEEILRVRRFLRGASAAPALSVYEPPPEGDLS